MAILRNAAITALCFAGIYLASLALSWAILPDGSRIGSVDPDDTIYAGGPRQVVYGRLPLMTAQRQMVFIGQSNVVQAFRPDQVSKALGGDWKVNNMALGGSNMTVVSDVVPLILQAVPKSAHRKLTIVLGIWYGIFATDKQRWQGFPTHVEAEELRYRLFTPKSGTSTFPQMLFPTFPDALAPVILFGIRPILLGSYLRSEYTEPLLNETHQRLLNFFGHPINEAHASIVPIIQDLDHYQLSDKEETELNVHEGEIVGPVSAQSDEGFRHLLEIAHEVSAAGARLVVVDMPTPSWHSSVMPQFAAYQQRKLPWLGQLQKIPNVYYVNLQNSASDDEFSDYGHPRPRYTARFASRIANVVHALPK